jgi:hypothetical protein
MVAIRRIVGKDEKSSGRWIHNETIRIRTEKEIENASPMSIMKGGIGRKSTDRMITIPTANPMSRPRGATFGSVNVVIGDCTSAINLHASS